MKIHIGIRREDKNPWERRVPLIPTHVRELSQNNPIEIWLQPSDIRVFPDRDYSQEGARIEEDLSSCSIIFAIKEIPIHFFQKDKVYVFFSHTIKGQPHSMPMLKKMMDLGCTLIDYERIASSIKPALQYASLVEAKEEIERIGWQIHESGLHPSLVPLVCGFAGYGHVSRGAQNIFDLLPFEEIQPGEMASLFEEKNYASHTLYKVVFKEEHMVKSLEASVEFELQDYYKNPQKYYSVFDSYLPFLTVLVNCIFWTPDYPRFVTKESLKKLFLGNDEPRLRVIGDISCDIEGSVEVTVRATTPDDPVFVYDLEQDKARDGVEGRGPVIMAVDNLPAEIALESSVFFSGVLKTLVSSIAAADFSGNFEDCGLPESVKKAVILYRGQLTPDYEYMNKFILNL
jgi:alpha-aminoadipic semialdehyde synthase